MSKTKQKVNMIRKISVKTVCGGVDVRDLKEGESTPLMRILGMVRGTKTGTTDKGDYVGFKGQFQATNIKTGEVYMSSICFLPLPAQELIEGIFDGSTELQFAFEIGAVYNKESVTNYTYTVNPLLKAQKSDAFKTIESQIETE